MNVLWTENFAALHRLLFKFQIAMFLSCKLTHAMSPIYSEFWQEVKNKSRNEVYSVENFGSFKAVLYTLLMEIL